MKEGSRMKILSFLYESDGVHVTFGSENSHQQIAFMRLLEELIDGAGIQDDTPNDLFLTLEHMQSLGLVRYTPDVKSNWNQETGLSYSFSGEEVAIISLTPRGFDLIHDYEMRKHQQDLMQSQNDANRTLAAFTVILGAAALVQAAAAVFSSPWPANVVLGIVYLIILIALWVSRDDWDLS